MNTSRISIRAAGFLVLGLAALSLSSCGDETAPNGAVIAAPGDLDIEYDHPAIDFYDQTAGPLEFQVFDQNGDPVPGVKIRFFGGTQTVALTQRGIPDPLSTSFTPLNASDALFFETTTDERGLSPTDIYATWLVPGCTAATDITVSAKVIASLGNTSAVWTANITSKCA